MRTKLKNKIHSIVLMKGIQISGKHCSFTHLFNEEHKTLNDYRINGYLHLIEPLDSEIKIVSKEMANQAKEEIHLCNGSLFSHFLNSSKNDKISSLFICLNRFEYSHNSLSA